MTNTRKILSTLLIVIIIFFIGIAIPKLTVHDKAQVDKEFRRNVMQAVNIHYDNVFDRLALWFGKSRIVSSTQLSAEVESFTLFRIPLGFFRGISDMKLSIMFNSNGEWSGQVTSGAVNFSSSIYGDESLWKIFIDEKQNIKFKYPEILTAKYISTVEWPPVINISTDQQLDCQETPPESSLVSRTIRRQVDDRIYCVQAFSEGAARSVYTEYSYSSLWNGSIVSCNFTLRYPQCYNYDEPKQTECKKERETFDLDGVVDRIFSSLGSIF